MVRHHCQRQQEHDHRILYSGTYPYKKWQSESVRPHWQEIREARERNPKIRAKERKAELEHDISELTSKKTRIEASISSIVTDKSTTGNISELGSSQAGNSLVEDPRSPSILE